MNPGFREALQFEWTKFRTARSTVWTAIAIAVVPPVMAVVVATTGSLQPDDTILGASLTGVVAMQLVAAALGALVMSSEYTNGTIRTTLTAQPRRLTVLGAKAALVAALLFVITLVSSAASFVIGLGLLDNDDHAAGEPWPALVGVASMLAASGVLGLAVGTALRRSAGAIAALTGVILLPSLLGPLFGDLQRWVVGATPTSALEKLTQTSDATHDVLGSLGGWPSLAIAAAYSCIALAGSSRLLCSRDS